MRNADTDADANAVRIEPAGESLQLAYELHAQPRGLLITARPPSILSASFSPDGSYVALPYTHGPLRICQVSDGECIASFVHRGTWVTKVTFTPDGKTICYGMEDGTVYIRPLCHLIS